MEVTGKIIIAFPETNGISKAGKPWKKREYIMEVQDGAYPQKIHFNFFGDRADQFLLEVGETVKLSFDINSREFNGRWYTDISGWRAEKITATPIDGSAPAAPAAPATPPNEYGAPYIPPVDIKVEESNDDLPF